MTTARRARTTVRNVTTNKKGDNDANGEKQGDDALPPLSVRVEDRGHTNS